jgi:hypothetical protein
MPASLSSANASDTRPAGELPVWFSFTCSDPGTYRSVARYLRYLAPGLAHLGPEPVRLALHVVAAEDVPRIAPGAPTLPSRGRCRVGRLGDDLVYCVDRQGFLRLDPDTGTASIWTTRDRTSDAGFVNGLVSIALLELASHRGFFGLHAAAVARDGIGYLLPAASGNGKTSLCLTLVREGFRYLTDDFVLLTGAAGNIRCLPFFRTFNLDVAWAERFPELSFIRELPPLAQGKRMVDPEQCYPGSRAQASRPTYLLFPTIVARPQSTVRPIAPREAFLRLLPESRLSVDVRTAKIHVRTLEMLARQSMAFELHHGRDFLRTPGETLRRLLESLPHASIAPGSP